MTRDEVLHEFSRWTGHPNPPRPLQTYWYDTDAMADEIVRLRKALDEHDTARMTAELLLERERRTSDSHFGMSVMYEKEYERTRDILAALREPSEAVVIAAEDAMDRASATDCVPGDWNTAWVLDAIRAALAAAEKEVQGE